MTELERLTGLPSYLFDPNSFAERFEPSWLKQPLTLEGFSDNLKVNSGILLNWLGSTEGLVFSLVAILLVTWYLFLRSSGRSEKRGGTMTNEQKNQYIKRFMSDRITDAIEALRYDGTISYQMKRRLYHFYAQKLGLPDLIPVHPKKVKHEINTRLASEKKAKKPKIPGEPPLTAEQIADRKVVPISSAKKPMPKRSGLRQAVASQKSATA